MHALLDLLLDPGDSGRSHHPSNCRRRHDVSALVPGGACSGNTMSFINAAEPSVVDLIVDFWP